MTAQEEGNAQLALLEPPASWPDRGRMEFKNVMARYRPELELVLKGISFTVEVSFQWKNPDFLFKNPDLLSGILISY